jgi:hypothetical protein
LRAAGVWDVVEIIRQRSVAVVWAEPIGLLFIDGLPDYDSVRADFEHFREWIAPGRVRRIPRLRAGLPRRDPVRRRAAQRRRVP